MANSSTPLNMHSQTATWRHYTSRCLAIRPLSFKVENYRSTAVNYYADTWRPIPAARGRNVGCGYGRVPTFLAVQRGSTPAVDTAEQAASELHSHNTSNDSDNDSGDGEAVYNGSNDASESRTDSATPDPENELRNGDPERFGTTNGENGAMGNGAIGNGAIEGDEAFWERRREEKALRSKSQDKGEDVSEGLAITPAQLAAEVERRRNFAIISHPDAGKTTLTEKLLLYGGAIHEAGTVKARRAARSATSDWMELEKQRGRRQDRWHGR